jgi:hypothetical protein
MTAIVLPSGAGLRIRGSSYLAGAWRPWLDLSDHAK